MNDSFKLSLVWAGALSLSVTMIAWAAAFSSVYAPVRPKDARAICAEYSEARNSAYCIELVRR
jgi:hypothetical protein